jgi:arylsulfatase A-like enzyme
MTAGKRPNLVMVTADSLRADHCGFLGSESELTPAIDRLADDGTAFTQAIAPGPRTPSSVPVLFTGEFMADDPNWATADWEHRQQRIGRHMERFTHLSERLQRRGYETAAFTANPWTTRESNFAAGFDHFDEISADSDDISSRRLSDSPLFKLADAGFEALPGDPFDWSWKKEWFSQWTGYFDLIRERLSRLSEPFFLWIFLMDSHQPYVTPRRFREDCSGWEMYYSILRYWQWHEDDRPLSDRDEDMVRRAYRDAVRSVDAFVETLTDETRPYDPVTVFFSDHGEALGEHDSFGHEQTLYEENLRVPFLVHGGGAPGRVHEQLPLQSLPDVLLDLAERGTFRPRAHTQQFVPSQTEDNGKLSIRTERWKFVADGDRDRLYDLRIDPGESTDVVDANPAVLSSLTDVAVRHERTQTKKMQAGAATEALLAEETRLP